jgi:hypothetical protein
MAAMPKPPLQMISLMALNRVMPPSGYVNTSAPLSVVKMTMVLSASLFSKKET